MHDVLQYVFSLWGMIIIGIVCGTVASVVASIAKQWRKARETEIEASLKAELVKQRYSAEDIERILRAAGKGAEAGKEC